jgi:hypothetical protein
MGYALIGLIKYLLAAFYVHVCPRGKAGKLGVDYVALNK